MTKSTKKSTTSQYFKKWYRQRRQEYIAGYGGKCACCGETSLEFLAVHHIDGGGNRERERAGKGSNLIREKIKQGFPPGMQVLCCNCHQAIGRYGYCPHQQSTDSTDKTILADAVALSSKSRAALVGELIASLEPPLEIKHRVEWEREIKDRIDAYDRGEMKAYSREEVMRLLGRDS